MGDKYVPSVKDRKATERFRQKQQGESRFIKPAGKPASKPRRKK